MKLKDNEQYKYRCDKCKSIKRHKDMYDDDICEKCYGTDI